MPKITKRSAAAGVIAAVTASGVAWATWTAPGTGAASAQAGHAVPVVTVQATTTGSLLYPGRTGDVYVKVHNANPFKVKVVRVDGTGPIVADDAHRLAGCVTHGVTFPVDPVPKGSNRIKVAWELPANETVQFTAPGQVRMSNDSANACQGATFTIPVALTAESAE